MPLTASIPRFTAHVDQEHLCGPGSHGPPEEFTIFGATSHQGLAIRWWGLSARGAVHSGLRTMWLRTSPKHCASPLPIIELWDCPSADMHCNIFDQLAGHVAEVRIGPHRERGRYAFTLDWTGSPLATEPDAKCGHVLFLDSGNVGVFPNNVLYFHDPELVDNPYAGTHDRPLWLPRHDHHRVEARIHHAATGRHLHYTIDNP